MNCEYVADNMSAIVYGKLPAEDKLRCQRHLYRCPDCTDAVRGAEALALLRNCGSEDVPDGLFDRLSSALQPPAPVDTDARKSRFWLGSMLGGAVAASVFAAVVTLAPVLPSQTQSRDVGEFAVSIGETRMMDVAIEADRALEDANISILLSGGIELDGYAGRRELTWQSDLEPGVNRLRLPVVAINETGGKMVVRLSHPQSEQVYVVRLDTGA